MVCVSQLKLCLVDMNNGVANQATRCFRRLADAFAARVRAANSGMDVTFHHVQPRNLGELPTDQDLVLSSGGPGSPFDGYEDPWCVGFRKYVDGVLDQNLRAPGRGPALFAVCHSYELISQHLAVGTLQLRSHRKFGVMPVYTTVEGQQDGFLAVFGDRLFAFEHRNWEVAELDEKRLRTLGGRLLARESRDGQSKGRGLMAFNFGPGVDGTIFHPEADRGGVVAWVNKPEMATAFKDAYGDDTYEQMMDTINDPTRIARTFALCIPGWLTARFNALADQRGWNRLAPPAEDLSEFGRELPAAI
jgi:hypothetical protein